MNQLTETVGPVLPDAHSGDEEDRPVEPDLQNSAANEALAGLIAEQLSGLQSGLAEINSSLSEAVEWGRESFSSTANTRGETAGPKKTPDPVSSTEEDDHAPQKITIVNKVPPTVVAVLKQQFKVMRAWMQPVHEATQEQRRENKRLLTHLEECTRLYQQLINRIEGSSAD